MIDKEDKKQPLFMISVVSRVLNVHPQTLRLYEREGLITPHRALDAFRGLSAFRNATVDHWK